MGFFSRKPKKITRPHTAAVIPAAGLSGRMGGTDKLFARLNGIPALVYSLAAFEKCEMIDEIVIAARQDFILEIGDLCREYKITKVSNIVKGGANRSESVYNALLNVSHRALYAAIHDGARPAVTPELITRVARAAHQTGAAIPAVPVHDTVKLIAGDQIVTTPNRDEFRLAQTPQIFRLELIRDALEKVTRDNVSVTDDAQALERLGVKVRIVPGDEKNIKLTVFDDLYVAETLCAARLPL